MNVFEKSYQTAQRNYREYADSNESYLRSIGFCAAGNLSKATANKFSTKKQVRHDKAMKAERKKLMLDIYNVVTIEQWQYLNMWGKIDELIEMGVQARAWTDDYKYQEAIWSNRCLDKLNALKYFIERYGNSREKNVLLPKLILL